MSSPLLLNGLNGSTGQPWQALELTPDLLARVARQERLSQDDLRDLKLRHAHNRRNPYQMGVAEGIDIADLSQAGWGIIFPAELAPARADAIYAALRPLLDLRREQAGRYYFEFTGRERGYRPGESKNDFLKRFGRGPGAAKPALGVPFYLLIAASPEQIPFEFQTALDVQYGVGRIDFADLEDYARYAASVVRAERGRAARSCQATFFGPAHDPTTRLNAKYLVTPLAEQVAAQAPAWKVRTLAPEQSTKAALGTLLSSEQSPALLFSAGHGLGFDLDDPRQIAHTGALVTQDWAGRAEGKIPPECYFSADDLPAGADLAGMIAFFFACFGAGSPRFDSFAREALAEERLIAPRPFLARLPLAMLARGALGVFAHVDRAWTCSFLWDKASSLADVETFRSLVAALINGKPAGAAGDYLGMRCGEISNDLQEALSPANGDPPNAYQLAGWWTAARDARNYAFIGDPAVRLAVPAEPAQQRR